MTCLFHMVRYGKKIYPENIPLHFQEIPAHFDADINEFNEWVNACENKDMGYSLHTEYSYKSKKFKNFEKGEIFQNLTTLRMCDKNGVPKLWFNTDWAKEFAEYIINFIGNNRAPSVIEIHPPFKDYCENLKTFVDIYKVFEDIIKDKFPDTLILIENRSGTKYKSDKRGGKKFVLSKIEDLKELADLIQEKNLGLRIAFDVPQIYTTQNPKNNAEKYLEILDKVKDLQIQKYIYGIHLWGKKRSEPKPPDYKKGRLCAHCGDLNSYFNNNSKLKKAFLEKFVELFDDNKPRKLVLEVNTSIEDVESIIKDLLETKKIQFI